MPLTSKTRDKLRTVSTATITTALFKRGLRRQMIQDVQPLDPAKPTRGRWSGVRPSGSDTRTPTGGTMVSDPEGAYCKIVAESCV
jgi:hypothetical protein